jgi:Domain of unknown function (DUF4265)
MGEDPSGREIAVHSDPVWLTPSNSIIHARLHDLDRWEELPAWELSKGRFEIRCIPFFVYDLALGDEVETEEREGKPNVVKRVVKDSGHYTFRVWTGDSHDKEARDDIVAKVGELRCEVEWYSDHLIAISAHAEEAQEVADYLLALEREARIAFETGRTKHSPANVSAFLQSMVRPLRWLFRRGGR